MEFNFTRDMEEDLDRVTSGSESWEKLVILFDKMLRSEIDQKADLFKDVGPSRKVLEDQCPKCSKNLVEIPSKNGSFISCSGYPDCKYIKEDYLEENCPECESPLVLKKSKKKPSKSFKACSGYPNCDWSEFKNNKKRVQVEVSDKPCPKCGKELHKRKGKKGFFFGCSGYPDCKHLENI
jgi:DNA topoisomerase-1